MAQPQDHISMALFCDFENVALGVRDANYDKFDIKRVLERLLLKGSIVVKKSYCDWERYKGFKAAMHEANFELIEIPHVRQSGKNSADIRLVVDALDLCYTKSHVNTFVIISGDSDFSPLVSKLRENAKYVIGVGVKQSTSDLLIANCDEFIFYDDLVRESSQRQRRENRDQQPQQRRSPEEEKRRREEMDTRRTKVVEMAAETYEALVTDRDEGGRIWASVLKEALKRRNPGFSESYYGFRTFGNLLEEAQGRGLLDLGRDEKSGLYVFRGTGVATRPDNSSGHAHDRMDAGSHVDGHEVTSHPASHPAQTTEQSTDVERPSFDGQAQDNADEARPESGLPGDAQAPRSRSERGRQRGGRKASGRRNNEARAQGAYDEQTPAGSSQPAPASASTPASTTTTAPTPPQQTQGSSRGRGDDRRGDRQATPRRHDFRPVDTAPARAPAPPATAQEAVRQPAPTEHAPPATASATDGANPGSETPATKRRATAGKTARKTAGKTAAKAAGNTSADADAPAPQAAPARKTDTRSRRPRKTAAKQTDES
jgi:uncharacterized LabA/DUF88 family protein